MTDSQKMFVDPPKHGLRFYSDRGLVSRVFSPEEKLAILRGGEKIEALGVVDIRIGDRGLWCLATGNESWVPVIEIEVVTSQSKARPAP